MYLEIDRIHANIQSESNKCPSLVSNLIKRDRGKELIRNQLVVSSVWRVFDGEGRVLVINMFLGSVSSVRGVEEIVSDV